MEEGESASESSEEENLPSLAYLLQPSPCFGEPSRPRPPSPDPEAAEVVKTVSSGSEDVDEEVMDVVPLHERVKMRVGAEPGPFSLGAGDTGEACGLCASGDLMGPGCEGVRQTLAPSGEVACDNDNGTRSDERSLCSLPVDSDKPSSPPVSRERPETSLPLKKRQYSQKEREAICQNAWQRRKEQEAKRREQEEEKERKRAVAKMLKAQRPGECQKYITVVLDPGSCPHSLHLPCIDCCLPSLEA